MSNEKRESTTRYPVGFRRQIVELVASGRSAAELSREFGAPAQSIGAWAAQAGTVSRLPCGTAIFAAR
jgi:transposase-like protein